MAELDLARAVCEKIERAAKAGESVGGAAAGDMGMIQESPIISLEEARRNTGLLERVGYELKRLVWA